ncbi:MAG: glycosyltransferase family 39 protein [bacterium]|nr:glycosyltransferase family 39 protein [bacterium]
MSSRTLLITIVVLAFIVRIIGINYGLPLTVVGDEVPFVFGALKMLELKTLLPSLHVEDFKSVLYFPAYLSYLYLIPFAIWIGIRFLFFEGDLGALRQMLISDPSHFFIIARFISALFGTAAVWLLYKVGKQIFQSERAGLLSAAFLALSFLPANFSHWSRHWTPIVFLFVSILYILSHPTYAIKKRYLLASAIAGIGSGINYQIGIATLCILFWFLWYDRLPFFEYLKKAWVYGAVGLYSGLVAITFAVYPRGFIISSENIIGPARSIADFLGGYTLYFMQIFFTEPMFIVSMLIGLVYSFLYHRRFFIVATIFSISYVAVFYFLFSHMGRYILMLYPLFALAAGYGLSMLWERAARFKSLVLVFGVIVFGTMLVTIMRFDALLLKNDTRIQALQWIETNIPAGTKIAVLAPLMRISTTPEAILEQERIDSTSLRSVDRVTTAGTYHALNLFTVNASGFYETLIPYLIKHQYAYVVIDPRFAAQKGVWDDLREVGVVRQSFDGMTSNDDDMTNGFGEGLRGLFKLKNNGPDIVILQLTF